MLQYDCAAVCMDPDKVRPTLRKCLQKWSGDIKELMDGGFYKRKDLERGWFLCLLDNKCVEDPLSKKVMDDHLKNFHNMEPDNYPLENHVRILKLLILHEEIEKFEDTYIFDEARRMLMSFKWEYGTNAKYVNKRLLCLLGNCELDICPSGKFKDEKRNHLRDKHNILANKLRAYKEIRLTIYYKRPPLGKILNILPEDRKAFDESRLDPCFRANQSEIISDLKTFVRKVIPIAKKKALEISPSEVKELTSLGWYFCLVGNCSTSKSAHLLRTKTKHFEHIECHMSKKTIEKRTKEAQIIILHNESGTSMSYDADGKQLLTPLIKLYEKWVKRTTNQQTYNRTDEGASNEVHVKAGFLCLLEDCHFGSQASGETDFRSKVRNHVKEKHAGQNGQIFSIRLTFKKKAEAGIGPDPTPQRTLSENAETVEECKDCGCRFNACRKFDCEDHDSEEKRGQRNFVCQLCTLKIWKLERTLESMKDTMRHNGLPRFCPICKKDLDYDEHLLQFHGSSQN